MRLKLILIAIFLVITLSSCSNGDGGLLSNSTEKEVIESLGYEKLYSFNNEVSCNSAIKIMGSESLGLDCEGTNNSYMLSVVGTNDEPTNILFIPMNDDTEVTTIDYPFPSQEEIEEQISNYNLSQDKEEDKAIPVSSNRNHLTYSASFEIDFYNSFDDINYPVYIQAATLVKNEHTFSFIISIHNGIPRLYHIESLNGESYTLIHEFN